MCPLQDFLELMDEGGEDKESTNNSSKIATKPVLQWSQKWSTLTKLFIRFTASEVFYFIADEKGALFDIFRGRSIG
jgi:hypothetical protein